MSKLCLLVAETLKIDPNRVSLESGPLTLPEWDSFNHLLLVSTIEETYSLELSVDEIVTLFNVGDIARYLEIKGIAVD